MNEKINVGDAVTLQHGGQKMTVESSGIGNGKVLCHCIWHDSDGRPQSVSVRPECLKKVNAERPTGIASSMTARVFATLGFYGGVSEDECIQACGEDAWDGLDKTIFDGIDTVDDAMMALLSHDLNSDREAV